MRKCTDRVKDAYDTAALKVAGRKDDPMPSAQIRAVTAFVKAALMDAVTRCPIVPPRFHVVDCACGRGQDMPKLHHALQQRGGKKVCASLTCMDVSAESLRMAEDMAQKWFRDAAWGPAAVRFVLGDVTTRDPWRGLDVAHVITCHLAVHYWCDTKTHLAHFFALASEAACPHHGLLLLTFADGRWVVRAGRAAMSRGDTDPTDPLHKVQVTSGPMTLSIHTRYLGLELPPPAPFGAPYTYRLQGRLEACEEYLVHEGALCEVARCAGWPFVAVSERVDLFAHRLVRSHPLYATMATLMGVEDVVAHAVDGAGALYRAVVFARTEKDAQAFGASVWLPERA